MERIFEIKNLNISFNISKNIVNTVENFSLTSKRKRQLVLSENLEVVKQLGVRSYKTFT